MDICDVNVTGHFTVQSESAVFEFVDLFDFIAIDGDVIQTRDGCVEKQFLCVLYGGKCPCTIV